MTEVTHLQPLDRNQVDDPNLEQVLEHAEKTKSPPVSWYLTMGHSPDVAAAFASYWEVTHRGGQVEHEIKELCRIQIAQMIGCDFCARQRSSLADEITDEEIQSCALPNWEHADPRTRAALHYARTLTLDDGREAEVYEELRKHYTNGEIVEMAAFFCLTAGGNRMAKSWGIDPREETSIPEGVMSIHDPKVPVG